MINDDILIKYSILNNFGGFGDWVSHVKYLSKQLRDIRDNDFNGIGSNDLSLISPNEVKIGKRLILCDYLDRNGGSEDNACILGLVTRINPQNSLIIELEIEGLGRRSDINRDPDRFLKWGTKIYPDLSNYPCLLEMITKPKDDGGSVYYYYNKSPRDLRINYTPGEPSKSMRSILGTLRNVCLEDLNSEKRHRAQHMHTYRRVREEIISLLKELPGNNLLIELMKILEGANKLKSKEISKKLWEKLNIEKK